MKSAANIGVYGTNSNTAVSFSNRYINIFIFRDLIDTFITLQFLFKPSKSFQHMATFDISINGQQHQIEADPDTPILWVLRDHANLVGTKYGCGIGQCGACTVHLNGVAIRSCSLPISAVEDKPITTIEGLSADGTHALQQAWLEHDVPQCGYCQAGQIMNAAALLKDNPSPSDAEIDKAMNGNICRCGTYVRIKAAIKTASSRIG